MAERVRPSRVWYFVGGLVAFAGVLGAVLWVVVGVVNLIDRVDDLQRVSMPGTGVVTFSEAGGYTVYLEGPGLGDQDVSSGSGQIEMEPVGGGPAVSFGEYDGSFTYDWGDHEGRAVLTFEIDEPGRYRVRTDAEPGTRATDVAIGRSITGGIFERIGLAAVITILALAAAAAIISVTAVRRHHARRALRPPPTGGTSQYPSQQPYPSQPPYPPQPQYPRQPQSPVQAPAPAPPPNPPPSGPPPPASEPGPNWVPPPPPPQ